MLSGHVTPRGDSDRDGLLDLSIVIPALGEGPNLEKLLPWLHKVAGSIGVNYELVVVTRTEDVQTADAAKANGARLLLQKLPGYGGATIEGLRQSHGAYVLTMDADLSHPPEFVQEMWAAREKADITIASRYVRGGSAEMPVLRRWLSKTLNTVFQWGISIPVKDLSSGFRLYRRGCLDVDRLVSTDFDILEEILIKGYCEGWTAQEIPFAYRPREHGSSNARVMRLARAYVRAFWDLWTLRNWVTAADYDYRAFNSFIPLQRYWQHRRHSIARELISGRGPVLDVGCGSSRILELLPPGSVAIDILLRKLRFDKRFGVPLVQASGFELPFRDSSFECVLSSQLIEHAPKGSPILDELCRVLKPGGRLVLGTPDYGRWEWVYIEKLYARIAPGAYADEHIAHYARDELISILEGKGFTEEATRYILRGELIMAFRKHQRRTGPD